MKKIVLLSMVICLSFGISYAQDGSTADFETALSAISVSVPFSNSATVGGKYFLDNKSAVEGGLSFNFQHEKEDENQEDGLMFEISGAYIQYLEVERISPYLKFGGKMSYAMGDHYELREEDEFGLSAIIGIGAEYFVTPQFSIAAEALMDFQLAPAVRFQTVTPAIKASFYFDYFTGR